MGKNINISFQKIEPYFFCVITGLTLSPVLFYKFFPTMDGAAHLYNSNLIVQLLFHNNENLNQFFQINTNIKCPTISLTPENNIYASWKGKQNRVFSVHFLASGSVRFVIFKPNDRHPEQQIRLSGTATSDILRETVTPYGVWDWISE